MRNISNREEYIKCLEDYMFISEANRPMGGSSYKLPFLAETIKDYREKRRSISPGLIIFTIIFNIMLTSAMMGTAIIWTINEVLKFDVPFSLRNIAIVSFFFVITKTKVGLFKEM
jgi:hypothetical protein